MTNKRSDGAKVVLVIDAFTPQVQGTLLWCLGATKLGLVQLNAIVIAPECPPQAGIEILKILRAVNQAQIDIVYPHAKFAYLSLTPFNDNHLIVLGGFEFVLHNFDERKGNRVHFLQHSLEANSVNDPQAMPAFKNSLNSLFDGHVQQAINAEIPWITLGLRQLSILANLPLTHESCGTIIRWGSIPALHHTIFLHQSDLNNQTFMRAFIFWATCDAYLQTIVADNLPFDQHTEICTLAGSRLSLQTMHLQMAQKRILQTRFQYSAKFGKSLVARLPQTKNLAYNLNGQPANFPAELVQILMINMHLVLLVEKIHSDVANTFILSVFDLTLRKLLGHAKKQRLLSVMENLPSKTTFVALYADRREVIDAINLTVSQCSITHLAHHALPPDYSLSHPQMFKRFPHGFDVLHLAQDHWLKKLALRWEIDRSFALEKIWFSANKSLILTFHKSQHTTVSRLIIWRAKDGLLLGQFSLPSTVQIALQGNYQLLLANTVKQEIILESIILRNDIFPAVIHQLVKQRLAGTQIFEECILDFVDEDRVPFKQAQSLASNGLFARFVDRNFFRHFLNGLQKIIMDKDMTMSEIESYILHKMHAAQYVDDALEIFLYFKEVKGAPAKAVQQLFAVNKCWDKLLNELQLAFRKNMPNGLVRGRII